MNTEPLNCISWAPFNNKTPEFVLLGAAGCDGNLYIWQNHLESDKYTHFHTIANIHNNWIRDL